MSEEERDFEDLLNDLDDKADFYRKIELDEKGIPIFFSGTGNEDPEVKYHVDLALKQIASMYANERCHRDSFLTEDEYIAHKEELKDREISMLLAVRDWYPEKIDSLISTLD